MTGSFAKNARGAKVRITVNVASLTNETAVKHADGEHTTCKRAAQPMMRGGG